MPHVQLCCQTQCTHCTCPGLRNYRSATALASDSWRRKSSALSNVAAWPCGMCIYFIIPVCSRCCTALIIISVFIWKFMIWTQKIYNKLVWFPINIISCLIKKCTTLTMHCDSMSKPITPLTHHNPKLIPYDTWPWKMKHKLTIRPICPRRDITQLPFPSKRWSASPCRWRPTSSSCWSRSFK